MRASHATFDAFSTVNGVLDRILAFAAAALVLAMVPGPGMFLIIRNTLRGGRRAALLTTAGNATGLVSWAVAAAAGLSALVAASQVAYDVLRIAGAIVLVLLGVQSLLSARRADGNGDASFGDEEPGAGALPDRAAYRSGLATNLANPKAAVFAVALYPQFIPDHGPVVPWVLGLALVQVTISSSWWAAFAWSIDRARRVLLRATVRRRLEQASGGVLVALGAVIGAGRG